MTEEEKKKLLDDHGHKELELLYQNVTSNLEARKKQQWQVLVFYSAVVAFLMSQASSMNLATRFISTLVVFAGAFPTGIMIHLYQKKMEEERKCLDKLYQHFSDPFKWSRDAKGGVMDPDCFERFFSLGSLIYLMAAVIVSMTHFIGKELKILLSSFCAML